MKVCELIEALRELPQDSEVFVYCGSSEDDDRVEDVRLCSVDEDGEEQMSDYYCQGDSAAREYIDEHPGEESVVVIGAGFYD